MRDGPPSFPAASPPEAVPPGPGSGAVPTGTGPSPGAYPDPSPSPRPSGARTALIGGAVGALVGALVAGGLVAALDEDDDGSRPAASLAGEGMDIGAVLDLVEPSVVTIDVDDGTERGVFEGSGSGVVISEDGLVLTNAHVIEGGQGIDVVFADGSSEPAELVGSLPDDDVALVQVDRDDLVPATLGSSEELQVGDEVVAIGNALDLGGQPSVTRGILSAEDRTIRSGDLILDGLLQTDAAINPGNSGGPLVNAAGEVVGINTAILEDAQNVGFAIAIDTVKPLIDDIRSGEAEITPDTALLGVATNDVAGLAPATVDRYGVAVDDGAFVLDVVPDSAADAAGLRPGDVIVAFEGEAVVDSADVQDRVRDHQPGDQVEITIQREGEELLVTAELGALSG
jgi:S1-C subfamily serine protease